MDAARTTPRVGIRLQRFQLLRDHKTMIKSRFVSFGALFNLMYRETIVTESSHHAAQASAKKLDRSIGEAPKAHMYDHLQDVVLDENEEFQIEEDIKLKYVLDNSALSSPKHTIFLAN